MAKSWSLQFGGIVLGSEAGEQTPTSETPFRILVLGNFSGQRNKEPGRLARARPIRVDRDNFDEVMQKLQVEIHWTQGENTQIVRMRELDHFHPDHLYDHLDLFAALRELREQLEDPATFPQTAARLQAPASAPRQSPDPEKQASSPSSGNLLDQILAQQTGAPSPQGKGSKNDLDRFLQSVVAPDLVPGTDPRQKDLVRRAEESIGEQMRALLHHPNFQEVEAAWRGLYFLVRRLDTDTELQLHLLDVTREELAQDVLADEPSASTLYKLVVEQTVGTPGAAPWAVLVGNYTFGPNPEDVRLLGRLGQLAGQAGAPFLAGANPWLVGCPSFVNQPEPEDWIELDPESPFARLREQPEASWLGLAAPRFLLRLPYGPEASTTERFAFEEMPEGTRHEEYLWGNPAIACAYLLGQDFSRQGWDMQAGAAQEVGSLPVHVYAEEGESQTKPCAEVLLTHRAAEMMLERGVMAFQSHKDRDIIRLARFQSLTNPPTALGGRWQG